MRDALGHLVGRLALTGKHKRARLYDKSVQCPGRSGGEQRSCVSGMIELQYLVKLQPRLPSTLALRECMIGEDRSREPLGEREQDARPRSKRLAAPLRASYPAAARVAGVDIDVFMSDYRIHLKVMSIRQPNPGQHTAWIGRQPKAPAALCRTRLRLILMAGISFPVVELSLALKYARHDAAFIGSTLKGIPPGSLY